MRDTSYSDSWYGQTWCSDDVAPPAGGRCNIFEVRYNLRTTERDGFSDVNYKKLACHEFGHTGGLWEQSDTSGHASSCMRQGQLTLTSYDGHDVTTINDDL